MALSIKDQLRVVSGELKPTAIGNGSLVDYTHTSTVNFGINFKTSCKAVDPETQPLAQSYLTKMLSAANKAITGDSTYRVSIMAVMASLISQTEIVTPQIVENATQEQWEDFINANIKTAIEIFAGVLIAEKAQYDSI